MVEEALLFGPGRNLVGILTEPAAETAGDMPLPAVLLLNAGFVHRVGPNRLHVKLARHFAALGFRTLRFDFSGIGDSPASRSAVPFDQRSVQEATEAMDVLLRTCGVQHFLVVGICSGAEIAFSLTQQEKRVVGAVLINGGFMDLERSEEKRRQAQAQLEARYYRRRLFDPQGWVRVLRGKSNIKAILRAAGRFYRRPKASPTSPTASTQDSRWLHRLAERKVHLLTVYSEGSVAWDLLKISPGLETITDSDKIRLEFIENSDHVLTPLWAQARLVDIVSDWATTTYQGSPSAPDRTTERAR